MTDIVETLRRMGRTDWSTSIDLNEAADVIEQMRAALTAVEPYLDAIICYASTMDEHEPNRIAVKVRAAMTAGKSE